MSDIKVFIGLCLTSALLSSIIFIVGVKMGLTGELDIFNTLVLCTISLIWVIAGLSTPWLIV